MLTALARATEVLIRPHPQITCGFVYETKGPFMATCRLLASLSMAPGVVSCELLHSKFHGPLFCGLVVQHNMPGKIVQYGLPALPLLFLRMCRLRIERDTHHDSVRCRQELDDSDAVAEGILNQLVRHDFGVRSGEIEAKATVLGFHAR